jgi:hypothetical protein
MAKGLSFKFGIQLGRSGSEQSQLVCFSFVDTVFSVIERERIFVKSALVRFVTFHIAHKEYQTGGFMYET